MKTLYTSNLSTYERSTQDLNQIPGGNNHNEIRLRMVSGIEVNFGMNSVSWSTFAPHFCLKKRVGN